MVFLWTALAAFAALPMVFGWRPVVISSDSMAPALGRGDVIVIDPTAGDALKPGEVITFDVGDGLVTHRIEAVGVDGVYRTRGDAAGRMDSTPVPPDAVIGAGRVLVPEIGWPVLWVSDGSWHLVVLWLFVMAMAALWARSAFLRPIPLVGPHGAIQPWYEASPRLRRPRRTAPAG